MVDSDIVGGFVELIRKAEVELPSDVVDALKKAYKVEDGIARVQIGNILKNIEVAKNTNRPMCQDTGVQTFFVKVGRNFPFCGFLKEWITEAVKKATVEIPLRPNTIDPFTKINHKDNVGDYIPAITWDFFEGDTCEVIAIPKGGGSENMSKLVMLKPGQGIEGIKDFVVKEMISAGGNPCPPTVVGIGIGGGADLAMKLGKKALLRPIGENNSDKDIAEIEDYIKDEINKSGIGPMGLGGKTTVLDVHIEKAPRHPASLPVGLVVQCWADRRAKMVIKPDASWGVL